LASLLSASSLPSCWTHKVYSVTAANHCCEAKEVFYATSAGRHWSLVGRRVTSQRATNRASLSMTKAVCRMYVYTLSSMLNIQYVLYSTQISLL
jgi:hypothetical protein